MIPDPLSNLTIVLIIASTLGLLLKKFKQPLIIAYLLTGLFVSLLSYLQITPKSSFGFLPDIGISFLLFMIGMELDISAFKKVGKTVFGIGLLHTILIFIWGIALSSLFGFSLYESLFLGLAVSFSSTVTVVKFLTDKKETTSLTGKILIGLLLVEDILAIFTLFFVQLAALNLGLDAIGTIEIIKRFLSLFIIYFLAVLLSSDVVPKFFPKLAQSEELLFLFSITYCLFFVWLSSFLGISSGIGAFLAGFSLSSLPFKFHISAKVKPLRDLFIALFFIDMASRVSFPLITGLVAPIILFTVFVFILKPYLVYILMILFHEKRRTAFFVSLPLGQISEFSLIICSLGLSAKLISEQFFSFVVLLFTITTIFSSIVFGKIKEIYRLFRKWPVFMEINPVNNCVEKPINLFDHIVLIGCHGVGSVIVKYLVNSPEKFVVVDFNPEITGNLQKSGLPNIFGDMGDLEILEKAGINKARLIISTVPNYESNLSFLFELRKMKITAPVFVLSNIASQVSSLYNAGATYVAVPEALGAEHLVYLLDKFFHGKLDKSMMSMYQGGIEA